MEGEVSAILYLSYFPPKSVAESGFLQPRALIQNSAAFQCACCCSLCLHGGAYCSPNIDQPAPVSRSLLNMAVRLAFRGQSHLASPKFSRNFPK